MGYARYAAGLTIRLSVRHFRHYTAAGHRAFALAPLDTDGHAAQWETGHGYLGSRSAFIVGCEDGFDRQEREWKAQGLPVPQTQPIGKVRTH